MNRKGKLVHLEHIEEAIFDGVNQTRQAIFFLRSIRDMLAGKSQAKYNLTTKFDGAPSLVAGVNPENGKFFVATKSAFNANPKLNYTNADIDANHPAEGLAKKLKAALKYLPELKFRAIYQGDIMFTKEDIGEATIEGVDYYTFRPNTIVYAVPKKSDLGKRIAKAQLGIVFHTIYNGTTLADMTSSHNVTVDAFGASKNVWYADAVIKDVAGSATFTEGETTQITEILSEAGKIFQGLNPMIFNRIANTDTLRILMKLNNNNSIRNGDGIHDTRRHVLNLISLATDKYNKEIIALKKPQAIRKRELEKREILTFLRNNFDSIKRLFDLQNLLNTAKLLIINKLSSTSALSTFIPTETGLRVSKGEGFVVSDHITGSVHKLVDRLEFSQNNFNLTKNWTK